MTQAQLAEKIGVTPQAISKWENESSMPDICILPKIAKVLTVSLDELFGMSTELKLYGIECLINTEEEIPTDVFTNCEKYLNDQFNVYSNKTRVADLLMRLYNHRLKFDTERVTQYALQILTDKPESKDCYKILRKIGNYNIREWTESNHARTIQCYKGLLNASNSEEILQLYYNLIEELIADHRTKEAKKYLDILCQEHCSYMSYIYRAYIFLAEYNETAADTTIKKGLEEYRNNENYLFEVGQYYAYKNDYIQALHYFKESYKNAEGRNVLVSQEALKGISAVESVLTLTEESKFD